MRRLFSRLLILVCAVVILTWPSPPVEAQQGTPDHILAQSGDAYVAFNDEFLTWEIGTAGISRQTDYDNGGGYRLISLKNKLTGREWLAPGNAARSGLQLGLDGQIVSSSERDFQVQNYAAWRGEDGSVQLEIDLARDSVVLHLHYAAFPGTSVIEQWSEIENRSTTESRDITDLDSISYTVRPTQEVLTIYSVQGLNPTTPVPNKPQQVPTLYLRTTRLAGQVKETIGSVGRSSEGSMGWFAVAATPMREGMFGGIEWSGAWELTAARIGANTTIRFGFQEIRHTLAPGEIFESPRRFIGFYRGDLDDAANASHDFARRFLLRPRPADFPWTQYNTWFAYYTDLDEERLKREVDSAAELGLEVFYIDAGWYEGSPRDADFSWGLGTWRENRGKFPNGLAAFSKYVHSKGLKFGLWVEPERVDLRYVGPDKEISKDWLAPGTAFDAPPPEGLPQTAQICLGNPNARAWMKEWLSRLVRDYELDWLKWDNNLWMSCDPPGVTGMGNYDHVRGLYEVLDYLRAEFPSLIVENCASGGNRMDYGIMRRTDIAWLSDQTEPSYRVRYHMFGASYPFPTEYLNSWLVESYFEHLADAERDQTLLRSWLRSRMMGAFGLSVSTLGWDETLRAAVAKEIKQYKSYRSILAQGVQFHLLPQSDLYEPELAPPTEPDAFEFYDPYTDRAVVFIFQGNIPWSQRRVQLEGLRPDGNYQLVSADGVISVQRTGAQLMTQSVQLPYGQDHPSTLLLITPISERPFNNTPP